MSLKSSLKFIAEHPLNQHQKLKAILRFISWQVYARIFNPTYYHQFTPRVKIIVKKGMTGASGNLYCGLHEFSDMGFLIHFLRSDDIFLDVGANVGSFTLLASGHVGARSHTFEPVPSTFENLKANIALNQLFSKVSIYNCAIGAEAGQLKFTNDEDTMNHIAISSDENVFEVEVKAIDELLGNEATPTLIKIDVEGFETEVIKGTIITLAKKELKAIIIELNGSGERYGYDESLIQQTLNENGFRAYSYDPLQRLLVPSNVGGSGNTIFIRDLEFVLDRIQSAGDISIHSIQF